MELLLTQPRSERESASGLFVLDEKKRKLKHKNSWNYIQNEIYYI